MAGVGLCLAVLPIRLPADAADNAAAVLAANCFTCHGTDGTSAGSIPIIDGKTGDYLLAKLRGFRAGSEENTIMSRIAKGYSDEQLQVIASFLARPR